METKFILINALNESLVLKLWDYNDHRKNTLLGDAMFDLSKLIEDATQENVESPVLRDGKPKGELKYDIAFYPVLEAKEGQDAPDSCTLFRSCRSNFPLTISHSCRYRPSRASSSQGS